MASNIRTDTRELQVADAKSRLQESPQEIPRVVRLFFLAENTLLTSPQGGVRFGWIPALRIRQHGREQRRLLSR